MPRPAPFRGTDAQARFPAFGRRCVRAGHHADRIRPSTRPPLPNHPYRGDGELPEIPLRTSGQRGRIAGTNAHNLWERLRTYAGRWCASPTIPTSPSPITVPKGTAHEQGHAERFRLLPNHRVHKPLLPDLQLSAIHVRKGIQFTVRHSDRPRRQRHSRAHGQRTISFFREYTNRPFPVV